MLLILGIFVGLWIALSSNAVPEGLDPSQWQPAQREACQGAIYGQVVDGQGQGLPGVLIARQTDGAQQQVRSDGQGRFAFTKLRAARQQISASLAGYVVTGPPGGQHAALELPPRQQNLGCILDLQLHLQRPAQISGQVLRSGNPVLAEIDLMVIKGQGLVDAVGPYALEQVQRSAADGSFTLAVVPGTLQLLAHDSGDGEAESKTLQLAPGQHLRDLVLDFDAAAQESVAGLQVLVSDSEGGPIAGAQIHLSGPALSAAQQGRSDAQGRWTLGALPLIQDSGDVLILAQAAGFRSAQRRVSVQMGRNPPVKLVLQPASGLFGRVLDPVDDPAPNAYVIVLNAGRPRLLRSDDDGLFAWPDAPDLEAEAWAVSPYYDDSKKAALRPGQECLLRLRPGAAIDGFVVDSTGQGIADYQLAIERVEVEGAQPYRPSVYGVQRGKSQAPGAFSFSSLRPGRYVFAARAEGFATARSEWIGLKARQSRTHLRLVLTRGAAVYGLVTDKQGQAVSGATINLSQLTGAFSTATTRSDSEGRYRIEQIEPGRQSLKVKAARFMTQVVAGIEVPERGEVRRDVVLAPAKPGADFSFAGIGAVLMKHDGKLFIRQVMPDYGAAAQGLRHGDLITHVDGEPIDDLELDQVVDKIRGEEGEPVSLDIERPGVGPITVDVERGQVVVNQNPHRRPQKK